MGRCACGGSKGAMEEELEKVVVASWQLCGTESGSEQKGLVVEIRKPRTSRNRYVQLHS